MPELSEIINVPPKRRITIPEGSVALIIPSQLAQELKSMCLILRKMHKRISVENQTAMYGIAGDLLLALMEAENG